MKNVLKISLNVLFVGILIVTIASRIHNGFLDDLRFPLLWVGLCCGFLASTLKETHTPKEKERGMNV